VTCKLYKCLSTFLMCDVKHSGVFFGGGTHYGFLLILVTENLYLIFPDAF
jgi:hypothetical protein